MPSHSWDSQRTNRARQRCSGVLYGSKMFCPNFANWNSFERQRKTNFVFQSSRENQKGEKNFSRNLKWIKHTNSVEKKGNLDIKTRGVGGGPTAFGKRMQIANGVKLKR